MFNVMMMMIETTIQTALSFSGFFSTTDDEDFLASFSHNVYHNFREMIFNPTNSIPFTFSPFFYVETYLPNSFVVC